MTLADLIYSFRTRADDLNEPYLWSNAEITLYLNQSDNEAAERALLIQDATTTAVCTLTMAAGTASYALHAAVLRIDRAKLTSTGDLLDVVSREQLDRLQPGWETATGTPEYVIEVGDGNVIITPTPTAIDTITLTVKRLPLTVMAVDTDTPEIPARHHYRMLDWALRCAYMKQDADAGNAAMADKYDTEFERSFGKRLDANVQRKQRYRRPNTIKSGW